MRRLEVFGIYFCPVTFFKSFFFCTHQDMQGFTHLFGMLSDPVMWLVLCSLNMIPYFIETISPQHLISILM